MLSVVSDFEPLAGALRAVEAAFSAAMAGSGDGPHGNGFVVGDTPLRVDQVRGIASMVGGEEGWTQREGRRLIRNDTDLGRLFLAYVVGRGRYLTVDDYEEILVRLCSGSVRPMREMDVAQFVNLVVAEPAADPSRELPIWVTASHKLATERRDEYFAQEIPGLLTDHDPLYTEIPEQAQHADALLPRTSRAVEPTLPRYEARLLAEAMPSTAEEVARAGSDQARAALWSAHAAQLEAYVGDRLLARVIASQGAS